MSDDELDVEDRVQKALERIFPGASNWMFQECQSSINKVVETLRCHCECHRIDDRCECGDNKVEFCMVHYKCECGGYKKGEETCWYGAQVRHPE